MTRTFAAAIFFIAFALSAPLSAKGRTSRITIAGADLPVPIEISDPAVLDAFGVWAGRGTFVNGVEQTEGFVVDWRAGAVPKPPVSARRYEVSFYVAGQKGAPEQLAYVVLYADDPSTQHAYVYLPGKADRWYALNARAIGRGNGVEGNWFRATAAWEALARPLIARASR